MDKKEIKYIAIEPITECNEEDEIDLGEIFQTIKKHKNKIITIVLIATLISTLYTVSIPNIYSSKTILIPKQQEKSLPSTASALASIAGINTASNSQLNIPKLFQELLQDFYFNKNIIQKYNLTERFKKKNMFKNMVFVFNFSALYKLLLSEENQNKEEEIYNTFKQIQKAISISTDRKSNLIILKASLPDRFLAKDLVEIYLKEMSDYIKKVDLKNIESQMKYYQNELSKIEDVELRENILNMISNLIKRKVLSQSGEFYMVKQLTEPKVAFIKDKISPKRSLIVLVTFISSFILAILWIFFLEFMKENKKNSSK